jgi:peptidyl-prolyl cis-trans isomerase D
VFEQGRGQVFTAPLSQTSVGVGRIDQVRAPVAALAAPIAEQILPNMGNQQVEAIGDVAVRTASTRTKASYDIPAARQALGLPEEGATPTPAQ